jgi:stage V sporulation protein G
MNITDVRIKLVVDSRDKLRAFCSVTFDDEFVVRDLKIIRGPRGLFVAMPSRRVTVPCTSCRTRVDSKSRYCTKCGARIPSGSRAESENERPRQYADIAHPINATCRSRIESAVLAAFDVEVSSAAQPGYSCRYNDPHEALAVG